MKPPKLHVAKLVGAYLALVVSFVAIRVGLDHRAAIGLACLWAFLLIVGVAVAVILTGWFKFATRRRMQWLP